MLVRNLGRVHGHGAQTEFRAAFVGRMAESARNAIFARLDRIVLPQEFAPGGSSC